MFKRDHIVIGILIGFAISFGIYGLIWTLDHFFLINHRLGQQILKTSTIQILAIICNLPLIQLTGKRGMEETSKGMIVAVMVLAIAYVFSNFI